MTVGALLDLGADRHVLEEKLKSLGVEGYHLHFGRSSQYGLDAYDFDVHLEEGGEGHEHGCAEAEGHSHNHNHSHAEAEGYSHDHDHSHAEAEAHSHGHSHAEAEGHSHDHIRSHAETEGHTHSHGHTVPEGHTHSHPHIHRNLTDIYEIIDRLDSTDKVKKLAKKMFHIVAEAEAKAHGLPMNEVHFHEVGAIDSIVDILGVSICLDNLGIEEVAVSPLTEGHGYVRCQHGLIPVPVPATANIAAAHGLILRLTEQEGEMVTPTGAAIAAALKTRDRLPESCRIVKTGMGAGKRDFGRPNVLRAMILETVEEEKKPPVSGTSDVCGANDVNEETAMGQEDGMWVLESNIDDCSGEILGFVMESLMEEGAADVWSTPIYMKKNRPAYMLSVLCRKSGREKLEALILTQTTTIGIRRYPVLRTVLERKCVDVETRFGSARVKVCRLGEKTFLYPEYESVRSICRKYGVDFQTAYYEIRMVAEQMLPVMDLMV